MEYSKKELVRAVCALTARVAALEARSGIETPGLTLEANGEPPGGIISAIVRFLPVNKREEFVEKIVTVAQYAGWHNAYYYGQNPQSLSANNSGGKSEPIFFSQILCSLTLQGFVFQIGMNPDTSMNEIDVTPPWKAGEAPQPHRSGVKKFDLGMIIEIIDQLYTMIRDQQEGRHA